jgi:hypothetical protein
VKPRIAALLLLCLPAAAPAQAPAASAAGTWDLVWQTRKGPTRSGWLVVAQRGSDVRAQIHGRGAVKASGTISGSALTLKGSRLAVPYVIAARVDGDRMEGSLKMLSVERRFTGYRRR